MELIHLYISSAHNFVGHHGKPMGQTPAEDLDRIECLAGRGIRGDRYLDYKNDYKGQITFFAEEVYQDLCRQLDVHDKPPLVFRRNIITRGQDLNAWIGHEFEIQNVRFLGVEECSPCHWMNAAFAEGAEAALKGRGGLRARILTNGFLTKSNLEQSGP